MPCTDKSKCALYRCLQEGKWHPRTQPSTIGAPGLVKGFCPETYPADAASLEWLPRWQEMKKHLHLQTKQPKTRGSDQRPGISGGGGMIEAPSVQVGQGLIHRVAAFSSSPPLYLIAPPLPHHGEDPGGDGKGRGSCLWMSR